MARTILIVGATGNTGQRVMSQLPELLKSSKVTYRILGLTRSLNSPVSKDLSKIPNVQMEEKDWTDIDAAWLKSQDVVRAYIAPQNGPTQFVEESAFHTALLSAGVKYVVRVSTNVKGMSPTSPVYYRRTHWAIENLLSQPEFGALHWTSLQPNFFTSSFLGGVVAWVESYSKRGKQDVLCLTTAEDGAVAMIDPEDVGSIGAHLLALEDPSPHYGQRYVLSGPEDVNGKDIIKLVEKSIGGKVENVKFKDTSFLEDMAANGLLSQKHLPSIIAGLDPLWDNTCSLSGTPTSKEILALSPPTRTVEVALKKMLELKGVRVPLEKK